MTLLIVDRTTDFRGSPPETGVTRILFRDLSGDPTVAAIFAPGAFGAGAISLNAEIEGGASKDQLRIGPSPGQFSSPFSFSAAGFSFLNWSAADAIVIMGSWGGDTLEGSSQADRIEGGEGHDMLAGGAGNDTLVGGSGRDTLAGGAGDDVYIGVVPAETIVEAAGAAGGNDLVETQSASFTLPDGVERLRLTSDANADGRGNALDNVITGNDARNILFGNDGNDTLWGGAGNDILNGGNGADLLRGGSGDDYYTAVALSGPDADIVLEDAGGGNDTLASGVSTSLVGLYVENLVLTAGAANGTGNAFSNVVQGNGGKNTLSGLAGNDTLKGAGGDDTISGGDGNDRLEGDIGADVLIGNGGHDTLIGGAGSDTMIGGGGADLFSFVEPSVYGTLGEGYDTIEAFDVAADRFRVQDSHFSGKVEAGGDTYLFHASGSIRVIGISGMTLDQWNALVLPQGEAANARLPDSDTADLAGAGAEFDSHASGDFLFQ